MSEVLFGQSYYLRFDPKLWAAMQPYPPLGTLYAASYLRARGYGVALFDAMLASSEQEWVEALDREQAELRGALRGQLQLPLEDVSAADARGRVSDDRDGPRAQLHRRRRRLRCHRPRPRPTWPAAPITS